MNVHSHRAQSKELPFDDPGHLRGGHHHVGEPGKFFDRSPSSACLVCANAFECWD